MASGLFEIRDATSFFSIVVGTLREFRLTNGKKPAHLLLLILGLAHLREWIAPGFKKGSHPKNRAECFAERLWENPDYKTVSLLANHAKHQRRGALPETQTTRYVHVIDDRDNSIDSWPDFDDGPASNYAYGDRNLEDLFSALVAFYEKEWFSLPLEERLSE
jgi:hypothetical protein